MYLRGRLKIMWWLLYDTDLANFVITSILRRWVYKDMGKKDKEAVIHYMEIKMPNTWESLKKDGYKLKDEHFV